MSDIDDATVVQLVIAGTVGVLWTVEAPAYGEREMSPGKEEPSIVFPQALPLWPQLPVVPLGPESMQVGGPGLTLKPVKFPELGLPRQDLQVRPILGDDCRIVQSSPLVVGGVTVGPAQRQPGSTELE
jgi:hypothetical protein